MNVIIALPAPWPAGVIVTLGACLATSTMFVWPRASSISALTAVTATGVSWTLASRNSVVTMISSICAEAVAAYSDAPPMAAAIAKRSASDERRAKGNPPTRRR